MNFSKIINGIKQLVITHGYTKSANELLKLSEAQLNDIGVSRELLKRGAKAYPWRSEEAVLSHSIPSNLTRLKTTNVIHNTPIMTRRPKAA